MKMQLVSLVNPVTLAFVLSHLVTPVLSWYIIPEPYNVINSLSSCRRFGKEATFSSQSRLQLGHFNISILLQSQNYYWCSLRVSIHIVVVSELHVAESWSFKKGHLRTLDAYLTKKGFDLRRLVASAESISHWKSWINQQKREELLSHVVSHHSSMSGLSSAARAWAIAIWISRPQVSVEPKLLSFHRVGQSVWGLPSTEVL